ncbi:MAG: GNAT family N-acetyltransferase [Paracoccaceae bacterium]
MPPNQIRTARLALRPLVLADAGAIARLIGALEVSRWLSVVPHPYSVGDAQSFIRDFAANWRFGIEIDGAIGGVISIEKQLGYWLGRKYWAQGYMSEAAQAVVNAWFLQNERTLGAGYFVENARSGAILRKIGFSADKIITRHSLARGCDVQCQQMTLRRADWLARDA